MRRLHIIILLVSLTAITASAQRKTLTILHSNDTHSTILPLAANLPDKTLAGRGGYVRRATLVEQERRSDPQLLLFDSGDFSQGSTFYTLFKGDVEVELMNAMGYDAATIGNHEFDYGMDNMARIFRKCKFPIVCANYDFSGTMLQDIVKPYVVLKRKGIRIGVFGLCPPLEGLVFKKNYEPIRFLDPIETAQQMVETLRGKEKCDLVICLSHLGWGDAEYPDNRMIGGTTGIDLVLGGHTHTYMKQMEHVTSLDGRQVPVEQNGKHAAFVGKITVTMEKKK